MIKIISDYKTSMIKKESERLLLEGPIDFKNIFEKAEEEAKEIAEKSKIAETDEKEEVVGDIFNDNDKVMVEDKVNIPSIKLINKINILNYI